MCAEEFLGLEDGVTSQDVDFQAMQDLQAKKALFHGSHSLLTNGCVCPVSSFEVID